LQQDYKDAFKFHLNQSVKPIIIQFFALASGLHPLPKLLFFFFFFNHWALALDSLHLCCFIVRWKLLLLVMIQPLLIQVLLLCSLRRVHEGLMVILRFVLLPKHFVLPMLAADCDRSCSLMARVIYLTYSRTMCGF